MPRPVQTRGRYMPGLDGLRALAVLAVVAYHLNLKFAPGGLLGVGVFFVLSGYLITDLLVSEWSQRGEIDMKGFWARRARRLLPALFVMLALVTGWMVLFDPTQLQTFRGDLIAGLLYISNWWFVFHHISYFASFGRPSPLGHLWSLAVEEQFYLIWPLVLVFFLRFIRRRGRIIALTLVLAIASALLMAALYQPGTDPSRVYYGTDTRAFSLLIGSAVAILWPSRRMAANVSVASRVVLDIMGLVGLLAIVWMMWQTNEYESFLYRGGMVVLSIVTAMVVGVLAHPGSTIGKVMGCKPLRWIGARSYGIYLWHYPVIILTNPVVDTGGPHVTRSVLQVAASILLAALSWKFIEEPIRHGAAKNMWSGMARNVRTVRRRRFAMAVTGTGLVASLVLGLSVGMPAAKQAAVTNSVTSIQPSTSGKKQAQIHTSSLKEAKQKHQDNANKDQHKAGTNTATKAQKTTTSAGNSATSGTKNKTNSTSPSVPAATTTQQMSGQGVTAIGDSVLIDAAPYLQKELPGIVIDAKIGRHLADVPAVIKQLKAEGELGNKIIIEMGTNGPFTKDQLVSVLQSLGNVKQIILVNTRVPREWQDVVNQTIAEVAASYPKTTLVNWYAKSANASSYFYGDGVHLNPAGSKFYASLLINALKGKTQAASE